VEVQAAANSSSRSRGGRRRDVENGLVVGEDGSNWRHGLTKTTVGASLDTTACREGAVGHGCVDARSGELLGTHGNGEEERGRRSRERGEKSGACTGSPRRGKEAQGALEPSRRRGGAAACSQAATELLRRRWGRRQAAAAGWAEASGLGG